jgi:hypothetical protein
MRIFLSGPTGSTPEDGAFTSRWCISEDWWFRTMHGLDVAAPPWPAQETRGEFMTRDVADSGKRLAALRAKDEPWWEEAVACFDGQRSRAWIMTRRLTHTAQHRGQRLAMLRMLGRDLLSTYGPTADTGGLMPHHAPTIYAYPSLDALLAGEAIGGAKAPLPGPGAQPVTERPASRSRDEGS